MVEMQKDCREQSLCISTIAIVGGSVVVVGILMIVLPGPAILVIPAGLAILGIEFAFARRWLRKLKAKTQETMDYFNRNSSDKS